MNKKVFQTILTALILVGLGAGMYFYQSLSKRPIFKVSEISEGSIAGSVRLYGKIVPENSADLGLERGGKITTLKYKVGDSVSAGAVLALSNATDLQAQYDQASALRDAAQNYLEQYEKVKDKDYYKWKSLKETSSANDNDRKSQKAQVSVDDSLIDYQADQLRAAQAGVRVASAQLSKATITAPFAGVIAKQDAEVGEVFAAGTPVLTLINAKTLKIEVWATEMEVKNLVVGAQAQIVLTSDQRQTYLATIDAVDPNATMVNNVSVYKVTLHLTDKTIRLTPGMDVTAKITTQEKADALIIPQEAVFSEGGKNFAYLSQNGQSVRKEIQTGITNSNNDTVEIISGLSAGDKLILPN